MSRREGCGCDVCMCACECARDSGGVWKGDVRAGVACNSVDIQILHTIHTHVHVVILHYTRCALHCVDSACAWPLCVPTICVSTSHLYVFYDAAACLFVHTVTESSMFQMCARFHRA